MEVFCEGVGVENKAEAYLATMRITRKERKASMTLAGGYRILNYSAAGGRNIQLSSLVLPLSLKERTMSLINH